jgi:hypothetical protein
MGERVRPPYIADVIYTLHHGNFGDEGGMHIEDTI